MSDINTKMIQYSRILLKLSGEYFITNDRRQSFSLIKFDQLVETLVLLRKMGIQVAIVIGGGNLIRGSWLAKQGFDPITSDYMGMLATVINGMALNERCQKAGVKSIVRAMMTTPYHTIAYHCEKAIEMLNKGYILIFTGGTGKPLCTTDTAASQRAIDIKAEILMKATKVNGVYPIDPQKTSLCFNKTHYAHINYQTVIDHQLNVMDLQAFMYCQRHKIPIRIFNMNHLKSIIHIINGENIGTLIDKRGKNVS